MLIAAHCRSLSFTLTACLVGACGLIAAPAWTHGGGALPVSIAYSVDDMPTLAHVIVADRAEADRLQALVDVWDLKLRPDGRLDALVAIDASGEALLAVEGIAFTYAAKQTVQLERALTRMVDAARQRARLRGQQRGASGIPGFSCYRTVDETFATAQALVAARPDLASWIDVGDSWLKTQNPAAGDDLMMLVLTDSAVPGPKPILYANGGIHAREYTTAEVVTRFAEYLVENDGIDPDVTWILDHHEVHLRLQANPDGRRRAETGLLWRKNANNNHCANTNDRGVDLNRNYSFNWNCCGPTPGECTQTFPGSGPASEPEVASIEAYGRSIFADSRPDALTVPAPDTTTGVILDVHSFGQDVLWSWGFTTTQPPAPNGAQLYTLGRKYAFFTGYRPMHGSFSTVPGSTKDFAYGELGVPGYTLELGTAFFQDCSSFESTISPDNLEALLYTAKVVRAPYRTPAGPEVINLSLSPNLPVAQGDLATLVGTADDTRYNNSNGAEPTQTIASARYVIGTPPWQVTEGGASFVAMTASDGAFDEGVEAIEATINTTGLPAGRHLVFVEGVDAPGNVGAVSAAWLDVIDPAISPELRGVVRDGDTFQPIANAAVRVGTYDLQTDGAGLYSLRVPNGTYDLSASADGYGSQMANGITVGTGDVVTTDFVLQPFVVAFADDGEGGNVGWTADPPWALSAEVSFSGAQAWSDSPGGLYANNVDASLTSPVLDLSDLANVELRFWHIYDFEPTFDFGRVEVSTDGGTSWTELAAYSQRDQTTWREEVMDLSAVLNGGPADEVRIRFRVDTDVSMTDDGWHIDDIEVLGTSTVPAGFIFGDGFESGSTSEWGGN